MAKSLHCKRDLVKEESLFSRNKTNWVAQQAIKGLGFRNDIMVDRCMVRIKENEME